MNTRSFMIILWIAAIIFFIPTEALADSDYSSNFSPQDTFMQVNITNGSISGRAEISLDVNSIEGADGREISLLYALYKNGRMKGIDTKSLAINSEGFSDNVTISFNQIDKPDTCKAFILDQDSYTPIIPGISKSSGDVGFAEVITRGELAHFIATHFELTIGDSTVDMSDIDGHEYEDSIMKMVQAGLMSPYPDGEFRPEGNVRRSEFATVIARFLELQNTDLSELRTLTHTINDLTDDAWYYSYMCIAINLSILQPDDSNMVYPDSWITTDYLSSNTIEIIYNSIALRIMAPDDNSEFYFPGINVLFNREIVMPGDLSKIHIYDGDTEIAISHVEPSGWPGELQISSDVIELDKTYKLVVESNLISDLQGIYYDEEIVIHFKYVEAPLAIDDGYTPPYYSFPGLNIKFNKDIVVPEDWTKIHLYNDNDIEIEITSISTSGYPQELQISSDAIEPDKIYRLVIEANVIKDLQGTYYDQEIVINFKYINPLQSGIGYVLDTADATPGLAGDAPLVMLLLKDGTRKVFEVDRDYYSIQDQNDVVTKDGIWLIQPGTAMLFNTDADEIIIKAEKRDMIESDESRLTENGYVDGKKVHESAFLLYYIEQNSFRDENYKIATLEELQGKDLSGIKYTLDSEGQIDFLMIQYYLPDEYGVITNTFQNDSITGFGINMIVDGSEIEKNSIDFSNYDIRKLYHIEEDINGNIVALTAVAPDIVIQEDQALSIEGNVLSYGSPAHYITLSNDLVVYKMDTDNKYTIGTISDISGNNAYFYDIDDDRIYDIVLLPGIAYVQKVILNKAEISLALGTSERLTATIIPEDAVNKNFTWLSVDTSIASVNEEGIVTGVKAGKTTIQARTEDGGKIAECEVTVSDIMGYVLDTADATSGLMGEDARIKLLLQDGTVKAFEADRDCHYSSDSDVITADGRWNVNTGSIIRFGTDAEGRINEIERKSIPGTNVNASITIRGYFDGFKVSDDAFIVLYSEKSSSDSDHYKVIPLDNILETTATDVDYSLNNNHSIDFMLIKYVPVNSVQLDKTSITMEAGSHVNLVAAIEPDTANIRGVSWHSSDTSVVTVGNDGLVTALKPGNATVTAISIDNEAMASCDVIVTESVSTITLNKTEISLYEGSEEILYYSISPGNFESIVNWSSSDQRIATASREGLVSAVSAGTAIITAQLENGKKAAACTVTVKSTTLYGVIVDVTRTSNDYGYEIEVLINGESRNYESINLLEADMTQLYRLNLNQAGVVIGIDPIDPNLIISGSEIVSISDGMLRYGEPEMLAFLSSDVVVYIADQDGEYENGSVNDIPGSNAYFYDIDDDRIYDIVLLPPV